MRISDWSSDVCSSDLRGRAFPFQHSGDLMDNDPDTTEAEVVKLKPSWRRWRKPMPETVKAAPAAIGTAFENVLADRPCPNTKSDRGRLWARRQIPRRRGRRRWGI